MTADDADRVIGLAFAEIDRLKASLAALAKEHEDRKRLDYELICAGQGFERKAREAKSILARAWKDSMVDELRKVFGVTGESE